MGAEPFPPILMRRVRTDAAGEVTLFPLRAGRWRVLVLDESAGAEARATLAQQEVTLPLSGASLSLTLSEGK